MCLLAAVVARLRCVVADARTTLCCRGNALNKLFLLLLLLLRAAVCPRRLLSFSVPVAVSLLSACCLAGDAHAAMAALTPAIKGEMG